MNIDKQIADLANVDKNLTLGFYVNAGVNYNTTSELISNTLKSKMRFTADSPIGIVGLFISCKNDMVLSIELTEFTPCCGKVIGRRLIARDGYYEDEEYTEIEKDVIQKAFKILFEVVDIVIENGQYSSISLIISAPEQVLFYNLMSMMNWKIVNEFHNERMSNKNLCVEYCKNYFQNDKK